MNRYIRLSFLLCGLLMSFKPLLADQVLADNHMPDYYQEPGVRADREYAVGPDGTEFVDPFSGMLRLNYTDLVIPGNGGLDIEIIRNYQSSQTVPGVVGSYLLTGRTTTGIGWDIHFGRVRSIDGLAGDPGSCRINREFSDRNPVLEMPDGTRQVLFNALPGEDFDFITKERWIARCIPTGGLVVTSPLGMKYTMDFHHAFRGFVAVGQDFNEIAAYHVTRIEDPNGNFITIDYGDKSAHQYTIIERITASDGRIINFTYSNPTENGALLTEIEANGQTWRYEYTRVPNEALDYYFLTRVEGPEKLIWEYEYYGQGDGNADPEGGYSVRKVTGPYGGEIEYSYQRIDIGAFPVVTVDTSAVQTRTVSGPSLAAGVWTYDFSQQAEDELDKTIVTTPIGKEIYVHCGMRALVIGESYCSGREGTLLRKEAYEGLSTSPVRVESYLWTTNRISEQQEKRPTRNYFTASTSSRVLLQKTINQDGENFSTAFYTFDAFDNPQVIIEYTGNPIDYFNPDLLPEPNNNPLTGPLRRDMEITYYINTNKWILRKKKNELLHDLMINSGIEREFDDNGNLISLKRYGDETRYRYFPNGDLNFVIDPLGRVTEFDDYRRGIPRVEVHPVKMQDGCTPLFPSLPPFVTCVEESFTVTRQVAPTGMVESEANGRGLTTGYDYDGLNRLQNIITPRTDDHDISLDRQFGGLDGLCVGQPCRSRTLTRGGFVEVQRSDGFGRLLSVNADGIERTYEYDALGRKLFESDPNSALGTRFEYDVLGRLKRLVHTADNSDVEYDYSLGGNKVRVTDERNKTTIYTYRSFGDPGQRDLVKIDSPESVVTDIVRYQRGDILSITQGDAAGIISKQRSFVLDDRYYPDYTLHPETGRNEFLFDAAGNRIESSIEGTINSSGTTRYAYDAQNRLTQIDYPDETPDVGYVYDGNGNLRILTKGDTQWVYEYDENDNLESETLTISGVSPGTFAIGYQYNLLDALARITYPSGLEVEYAPDNKGWPTRAGGFVASVSYHPTGQPDTIQYGNGVTTRIGLDDRLFPSTFRIMGLAEDLIDLTYAYDNTGNVESIVDALDPLNDISMTYDGLNRLITANGVWGEGSVGYNAIGNITSKTMGDFALLYHYGQDNSQIRLSSVSGSLSRSYSYDIYGNVSTNGSDFYIYDHASSLVEVPGKSRFVYDGNNRRVIQQKDGLNHYTIYNRGGQLLYEQGGGACTGSDYIRLGLLLVARRDKDNNESDSDSDGIPDCNEINFGLDPNDPADAELDSDGDQLSNIEEFQNGTDIDNVDTDGDRIFDGYEVSNDLNPLVDDANDDSDGDGFSNLQEFQAGTDANDSSSFPDLNAIPRIEISMPADGSVFLEGSNVAFSATAVDADDNDISANISWSSSLDGAIGMGANITGALSSGTHVVTARVADSVGLTNSASITVTLVSPEEIFLTDGSNVNGTVNPSHYTVDAFVQNGFQITVRDAGGPDWLLLSNARILNIPPELGTFFIRPTLENAYQDGNDLVLEIFMRSDIVRPDVRGVIRIVNFYTQQGFIERIEFPGGMLGVPNHAPSRNGQIPDQAILANVPYSYQIPATVFVDGSFDLLAFSATLANGSALPGWLAFNPETRIFSGTPGDADNGILNISVRVRDTAGQTASDTFNLNVGNINVAPVVSNPIPNQTATEAINFSFQLPANTFNDINIGDVLTFSANLANGSALPAWLSFDSATQTFSGIPGQTDIGTVTLLVTATDSRGLTVADSFQLTVKFFNDPPFVQNPIVDQTITEFAQFNFQLPANTFADPDLTFGDRLFYAASLTDGSPLPAWLSFNSAVRVFIGSVPNVDMDTPLHIRVTAADLAGLNATADFQLLIENLPGGLTPRFELSSLNGVNGFSISGVEAGFSERPVSILKDIDSDGYDEIIIGSRRDSSDGQDAGKVNILFGSAASPGANILLSDIDGNNGFVINGANEFYRLGTALASLGDVNADGFADFVVTTPGYDVATGRSYVVFGNENGFPGVLNIADLNGGNGFAIEGIERTDNSGESVASAGDVNGDGIGDIVIGAPRATGQPESEFESGEAYVVFGRSSDFPPVVELSGLDGTSGFHLDGVAVGSSGFSVGGGDINGDGLSDVLVGDPQFEETGADPNSNPGAVYLLYGRDGGFNAVYKLNELVGELGFRIDGNPGSGLGIGYAVASAGDINGDGLNDFVFGAPLVDSMGLFDSGESYVVFGRAGGFPAVPDISQLDGSNGFTIRGMIRQLHSGHSVSLAGDMNGDGYDDLIVGTDRVLNAGESYLIFGGPSFPSVIELNRLNGLNGITFTGLLNERGDGRAGNSVDLAGDVNGDGFDDLIISDPAANPQGVDFAGESYLVYGKDFRSEAEFLGADNDDTLIGNSADNILIGGRGNDVLDGQEGNDVLRGGAGDDTLIFDFSDTLAIDGGSGQDTLSVQGTGQLLDLTALNAIEYYNLITDIEIIDIAGSGDNTLALGSRDLLSISQVSNTLRVNGNTGDTVITIGDGWSHNGTIVVNSQNYNQYINGQAILQVSAGVNVELGGSVNSPPSISIFEPANGSEFSSTETISFSAEATDVEDGSLNAGIQWSSSIDGVLGAGANISATLSPGVHTVTASASDSDAATSTASVTVTVNEPPNTQPVVAITLPADGSSYIEGATVDFNATATDAEDGDLGNSIEWHSSIDGVLGTGAGVIAALSIGSHTVTASVTDTNGGTASDSITVIVQANTLPTVNILAPADGGTFIASDLIVFSANAEDAEDGNLDESIQWSSSLDGFLGTGSSLSTTLSIGSHAVTASVTDSHSDTSMAIVQIIVNPEPDTPPVIGINSPVNGSVYTVGNVIGFSATATDAEDGDLGAAVQWVSSLDGALGSGAALNASLSLGSHVVTAGVTDSDGNTQTANVDVIVTPPPNQAPTLAIETPVNGAEFTVGDQIGFSAAASDPEDGDLGANIQWTSDLQGPIGTGAGFSAALTVGSHDVTASVTDSGGATVSATVTINVTPAANTPPQIAITVPDDGSGFDAGESITFTASAADAEDGDISGNIQWRSDKDGILGAGASINVVLSVNSHVITAEIADNGLQTATDSVTVTVQATGGPVTGVTLSTDVSSPQPEYSNVVITAQAEGGSGNYEYQFRAIGLSTGLEWQVLQDYSGSNSVTWNTGGYLSLNWIEVRARNAGSQDTPATQSMIFYINRAQSDLSVSLNASADSPQPRGSLVTLTARADGGSGDYQYRFRVRGFSTLFTWRTLQDYSPDPSVIWDTGGYWGWNQIEVSTRNANGEGVPAQNRLSFTVR